MIILLIISCVIMVVYALTILPISIQFFLSTRIKSYTFDKTEKKVSVLIPVRNESENILNCLNSLALQNYSVQNFEVIVVNDHSTDDTEEKVKQFIKRYPNIDISYIELEYETSKKKALALGIRTSKYEIIATTDADCTVPNNWLKNISEQFEKEVKMLTGPVMFTQHKGFLKNFQVLDMLAIQGVEFGMLKYSKAILNNAANLAYSKESFEQLDGYDDYPTPSGDDVFLLEKFRKSKFEIKGLLSREFVVETLPENNLKDFLNQRLRWSSKTKYYKMPALIYFGVITLVINVLMILIYIGLPLVEKYRLELLFFLSCKWLIDFILLLLVASFFERRKALFYFIPIQLVYPFYIVFVWVTSLTGRFEWKGRKFNA